MRQICRYLPLLSLLPFCVPLASAQSSVDFMLGFGTAFDSSNGGGIDNASSANAYGTCMPNTGDTYCQTNPKLGGFFLGIGGDVMLHKSFGIGAEVNVQPAKSNYGPLQYRETFYDFNGIFAPVNTKRAQLQIQGGIGGAQNEFLHQRERLRGNRGVHQRSRAGGECEPFPGTCGRGRVAFCNGPHFRTAAVRLPLCAGFHQSVRQRLRPGSHCLGGLQLRRPAVNRRRNSVRLPDTYRGRRESRNAQALR